MLTPISLRVERVHRVLGVDEGAGPAELLRLGEHVVDERRLAGGLRPEDLDDAPARDAADAQREVERERAGRDRGDANLGALVAHAHDGALAELALDLRQRALEGRRAGLRGLLVFCRAHRQTLLSRSFGEVTVRDDADGTRGGAASAAHASGESTRAPRSARRPGSSVERNSVAATGAKRSAGVGGSSRARWLPARMRATVTCGRKRSRRRSQPSAAASVADERRRAARAARPPGRRPRPRARAGAAAAATRARPTRRLVDRGERAPRTPPSARGDRAHRRRRLLAEEAEREVQRRPDRAARLLAAADGAARPARERVADRRSGSSAATNSRIAARLGRARAVARAEQQAPQQVHRRGRRALADVGAVAALVGCGARSARPSAGGERDPDEADRLLGRAAVGAGDAGDADPDVGADALARAVGERDRDLLGDGAVRARSAPPARPRARS